MIEPKRRPCLLELRMDLPTVMAARTASLVIFKGLREIGYKTKDIKLTIKKL